MADEYREKQEQITTLGRLVRKYRLIQYTLLIYSRNKFMRKMRWWFATTLKLNSLRNRWHMQIGVLLTIPTNWNRVNMPEVY